MHKLLTRRPDTVFYLIAGYFLLCVILRLLRPDSLEIDESEQAFLSQYFLAGYGPQPPFYNWLQYGLAGLFGISIATLTVLKNSLLFLSCLFYGFAARTIISNRSLSAIAMLGVLTLPPVFLLSQRDLSHTVAALFAVSLFLFGFFRTLKAPSFASYVITGVAVGIGLMSKYNFVVVPVAAIIAILPESDLRKRIFDWRVLVVMLIALVIVAPHAYWLLHNIGSATGGTLHEMKEGGPSKHIPAFALGLLSLANAVVQGIAPTAATFALVFYRDIGKILRAHNQQTRILGRMLIACFVIVLLIVIGVGATHIREKWLALFVVLLPLYLALKVDAAGVDTEAKLPAFATIVGTVATVVLIILSARVIVGPMIGSYSRAHIPYGAFADSVVRKHGGEPASILTTDRITAGNLRIQFPHIPVVVPGFPANEKSNPLPLPLLLAWPVEGQNSTTPSANLMEFLATKNVSTANMTIGVSALPYNAGIEGDAFQFGYGWIASNR